MLYRRHFNTINTDTNLPVREDSIKLYHLTPSEGKQGEYFQLTFTSEATELGLDKAAGFLVSSVSTFLPVCQLHPPRMSGPSPR